MPWGLQLHLKLQICETVFSNREKGINNSNKTISFGKKQMVSTGPWKAKLLYKSLNDKGSNFLVF